jgi:four helix bundle protein
LNKAELEQRTKEFSLNLIRFLQSLPKNYLSEAMGRQLLKSGTSIGANYREANRAESKADFIHKLATAEKEASETVYWLEFRNPKFKMNQPSGGSRPSAMARRRLMGNCSEKVSASSSQRSFSIRVILIPFCNMVRSAPS